MIIKAFTWFLVLVSVAACAGTGPGAASTSEGAVATAGPSAEHGRTLFRNKACVTCHVNNRVTGDSSVLNGAPDLTGYTNDPAFLRRWLADPPVVRPGTRMPNLHLSAAEIEDLITFLNEPR